MSAPPCHALAEIRESRVPAATAATLVGLIEKVDHGVEHSGAVARDAKKVTEVAHRLQGIEGHAG